VLRDAKLLRRDVPRRELPLSASHTEIEGGAGGTLTLPKVPSPSWALIS
jgi:hypothetical protein